MCLAERIELTSTPTIHLHSTSPDAARQRRVIALRADLRAERGPVCDDPGRVAAVARALAHAAGIARLAIMPYWTGEDAASVERALTGVRFRDVQDVDGTNTAARARAPT